MSPFSVIRGLEATIIDLTPKERGVEGGAVEDALRLALCSMRALPFSSAVKYVYLLSLMVEKVACPLFWGCKGWGESLV